MFEKIKCVAQTHMFAHRLLVAPLPGSQMFASARPGHQARRSIFEEKEEDDIISQLFHDYSIHTGCLKVSVSNVMTVIYRVFLKIGFE